MPSFTVSWEQKGINPHSSNTKNIHFHFHSWDKATSPLPNSLKMPSCRCSFLLQNLAWNAAFSICQTVGQRAAGECLLCIQEAHRAAEWPEVRASAVLLKRHLCLHHPLFPPRSQALSFPLLLLLLSSSSGLRRTAVSKCCDLMRGNLLDLMYKFARGSDSDKDNYIHIVV